MKRGIEHWQKKEFIPCMREYGVEEGATVVDYGCSVGNYSFPMADLVGNAGKVYAVDNNPYVLGRVNTMNQYCDYHNVYTMMPEKNYKLFMADDSANAFLLYDLFHRLRSDGMLDLVIEEGRRILKKGGLFSVLPFHMSNADIQSMVVYMKDHGLELMGVQRNIGLHFEMQRYNANSSDMVDDFERGDIYQFKKIA